MSKLNKRPSVHMIPDFGQKVSAREICNYYGQNYDNIRHMKQFIKQLKNKYKNEGYI